VSELLWEFNDNDYYTVAHADNNAILINGNFPHTVLEVLQTAPCIVQQWCDRKNLSINPNKMVIIPFTTKREIMKLMEPIIFNNTIQLSNEVRKLGLMLDKGLTWKNQLDKVFNKAHRAFCTCRGMFGRTEFLIL
jgi:hypothetical protein